MTNMLHSYSDDQLFHLIKSGNESAFDVFFKRHWKNLFRTVLAFISNQQAAEDIIQELFADIWLRRAEIQTPDITAYLFKSAKLQSFKYFRDKKPTTSLLDKINNLAFAHETEDQIDFQELKELYEASLKTMPVKTAEVYKLSRVDCFTHREIANQLQISSKTVEYHISCALKHIRAHITEYTTLVILWLIA